MIYYAKKLSFFLPSCKGKRIIIEYDNNIIYNIEVTNREYIYAKFMQYSKHQLSRLEPKQEYYKKLGPLHTHLNEIIKILVCYKKHP